METTGIQLKPLTPEEVSNMTDQEVIQKSLEIAETRNFRPAVISLIKEAEQKAYNIPDLRKFLQNPEITDSTLMWLLLD